MNRRRVVVTGQGLVSPFGCDTEQVWQSIKEGKSGVRQISVFDTTEFSTKIAAECRDISPEDFVSAKDMRTMDTFTLYGIVAAQKAMDDSGIDINSVDQNKFGIAVGSGIGGLSNFTKGCEQLFDKPRKVNPYFIPSIIINILAGQISIRFGCKGPNFSIVTACTTGAHNIGHAVRAIQYGEADYMLAGGSEMAVTPLGIAGFSNMKALSKRNDDPVKASRPWDRDRDGFVLGSGAAILVLEEYEMAKKRGANILAEVIGIGSSADAYHMTSPSPDGDGAYRSMKTAINDAGIDPKDVHYINAHATSTPAGDAVEVIAVKKLFDNKTPPMSSTKSMIGHLLGAAGAIECIFSILAIRDNVAPPTINLDNPSEGCDINLVAHTAQEHNIECAMSNSFGFGGTNGSIIFKRI